MIRSYSLQLLEKKINQLLRLDPLWDQKIAPLNGHVIQLIIQPLASHFFLIIEQNTFLFRKTYQGVVHTTIESSPLGFIRLSLLPASKVRSLFNDGIKISGDVLLGQDIKTLFDSIDLDWEGYLAQFTGDIVAHQIGHFFRKGKAFTRRQLDATEASLTEYVQEELRWFPPAEEISDFYQEIDALFLETERIEARIQQYVKHYEKN